MRHLWIELIDWFKHVPSGALATSGIQSGVIRRRGREFIKMRTPLFPVEDCRDQGRNLTNPPEATLSTQVLSSLGQVRTLLIVNQIPLNKFSIPNEAVYSRWEFPLAWSSWEFCALFRCLNAHWSFFSHLWSFHSAVFFLCFPFLSISFFPLILLVWGWQWQLITWLWPRTPIPIFINKLIYSTSNLFLSLWFLLFIEVLRISSILAYYRQRIFYVLPSKWDVMLC